jgi:hypothetical protein
MRLTILTCLVALGVLGAPAAAQGPAQGFALRVGRDEFDDSDRSFIYTIALNADRSRPEAALVWRCMDDGLNVMYNFDRSLTGDRDAEVLVRYRIDDLPPTGFEYWGLMTTNKAAWMPMHQIRDFTLVALRSARIVVEVEDPVDHQRVRDTFSLQGLAPALLRLQCR